MSVAAFALSDSTISEVKKESAKKLMPKRIYTAARDSNVVPEPR